MTGSAGRGARGLAPIAIGGAVGVTAWLSMGTLAVVDAARMTRVAALPPWTWLAALAGAGAVAGATALPRVERWAPLALLGVLWLPWLPLHVPAAFMPWDGVLEVPVWLAALGGLAWPAVQGRLSRSAGSGAWRDPRRAPWAVALLAAAAYGAAWQVARPRVPAGDEPHYLVITQSLLHDADFQIENNHRDGQYLAYFDGVLRPDFMRRGTNRQIYSIHAPGVSILVLPAFAAAGYAGAVATVIALVALGLALAWRAAHLLTDSAGAAWAATLAVGASAPVALHGFMLYPDGLGGAMAMAGVFGLVALERGVTLPRWGWLAIGGALALLPWLHTRLAIVAGVLGVALVLRLARHSGWKAAMWRFLAVPVVSATAWLSYFWLIYGTPNPAAPYGARPEGGLSFVPTGLAGLLVDQQFGLASNAPVLVAALAGLGVLAWRRPRLAAEIGVTAGLYLTLAASYPMWWGGYSAPARFAAAILPMLVVPLAATWVAGGAVLKAGIAALGGVSAAITAALVGIDRGAFIYNGRDGHDLLLDWLSPTVDLTLAAPSVHRDGAGAALGDAMVWAIAIGLVTAVVVRAAVGARLRAFAPAIAWLAAPLVVMTASTVVWAGHASAIVTPPTSQLTWLERRSTAPGTVALQLAPTRATSLDDATRRLALSSKVRGGIRQGPQPLLYLPEVPAGSYDVFAEGTAALEGALTVRIGRQDLPLESWPLAGRPAGFTGLVLNLPADVHSVSIAGDDTARAAVRRLALRPRTLAPRGGVRWAARAARFGRVALYALDDNAFFEPGALWVRGGRTTSFLATVDDGVPPVLRLKAGPVANDVDLAAGGWRRHVSLLPGGEAEVPLPPDALAPAVLRVTSRTGFRPSESDPGSGDVRVLGVFVTWPG
ncbi:MAG: hypothetical protein R2745_26120 [Vicinamibacterales bacterium]